MTSVSGSGEIRRDVSGVECFPVSAASVGSTRTWASVCGTSPRSRVQHRDVIRGRQHGFCCEQAFSRSS